MNEVDKQVIGALEEAIPMTSPTTEAVKNAIRGTVGLNIYLKHPKALDYAAEAAIAAHLAALKAEGYVVVPVEPTDGAATAGKHAYEFVREVDPVAYREVGFKAAYRAMIAAHEGE